MTSAPLEVPSLILRRVRSGESREPAVRLLADGGRHAEPYVRASCEQGEVFVLRDVSAGEDEPPVGAAVTLPVDAGRTVELRLLGAEDGAAGCLLAALGDALRALGARRLLTSTTNAQLAWMARLQQAGFRFAHVERDACTPERGWTAAAPSGIRSRDLVWFDYEL